jgi:hypothetical protein
MATRGSLFEPRLRRAWLLLLLAVCVVASASVADATASARSNDARTIAGSAAQRWAARVQDTARLGAEPPGRCWRLNGRHGACSIAIAILARDASGRRPWRCSATLLVSRAGHTRRTGTRCVAFPRATVDPAAALGAAVALRANGDVACLSASDARATCVMRYRTATARSCTAAASVPLASPGRSVALGAPICRERRQGDGRASRQRVRQRGRRAAEAAAFLAGDGARWVTGRSSAAGGGVF